VKKVLDFQHRLLLNKLLLCSATVNIASKDESIGTIY